MFRRNEKFRFSRIIRSTCGENAVLWLSKPREKKGFQRPDKRTEAFVMWRFHLNMFFFKSFKDIHNTSVQFEIKEYGKVVSYCFYIQLFHLIMFDFYSIFSSSQVLSETHCTPLHPQNGRLDQNQHIDKVQLRKLYKYHLTQWIHLALRRWRPWLRWNAVRTKNYAWQWHFKLPLCFNYTDWRRINRPNVLACSSNIKDLYGNSMSNSV